MKKYFLKLGINLLLPAVILFQIVPSSFPVSAEHGMIAPTTQLISGRALPTEPPLAKDALKVVIVSPEAAPFSKAGGLGDYMEGLPAALRQAGEEAIVITPLYANKKNELMQRYGIQSLLTLEVQIGKERVPVEVLTCKLKGVTYYFLANPVYFDELYKDVNRDDDFAKDHSVLAVKKAALLSRGALELMEALKVSPSILHSNDWMSALVPTLLKTDLRYARNPRFARTKTVHTLHNVGHGFQGNFPYQALGEGGMQNLFDLLNLDGSHFYGMRYFKGDLWWSRPDLVGNSHLYDVWRRPAALVRDPTPLGNETLIDWMRRDPADLWELNLTAAAVGLHADQVVTVSPNFKEETLGHDKSHGLELLLKRRDKDKNYTGIINGTDAERMAALLEKLGGKEKVKQALMGDEKNLTEYLNLVLPLVPHLNQDERVKTEKGRKKILDLLSGKIQTKGPVLGMVTRISDQKGVDLVVDKMEQILRENPDLVFVFLGSPPPKVNGDVNKPEKTEEEKWADKLAELNGKFPGRVNVIIDFNSAVADLIYLGADMFLMPSRFEPGGIAQLIAMAVGTVPIVRNTGGLADTVIPFTKKRGTGFLFDRDHADAMETAVMEALDIYRERPELWRELMKNGKAQKFTWENTASAYDELYRGMIPKESEFQKYLKRLGFNPDWELPFVEFDLSNTEPSGARIIKNQATLFNAVADLYPPDQEGNYRDISDKIRFVYYVNSNEELIHDFWHNAFFSKKVGPEKRKELLEIVLREKEEILGSLGPAGESLFDKLNRKTLPHQDSKEAFIEAALALSEIFSTWVTLYRDRENRLGNLESSEQKSLTKYNMSRETPKSLVKFFDSLQLLKKKKLDPSGMEASLAVAVSL